MSRSPYREPVILLALFLRLLLLVVVLASGNWSMGDTGHYIYYAQEACRGEWGGTTGKPNLYPLFLCAFSPTLSEGVTAMRLFLPLGFLNLLTWYCGTLLWRKANGAKGARMAALVWLFDPTLLIYGNLIMSDALFSVTVFALGMMLWKVDGRDEKSAPSKWHFVWLAVLVGALPLSRSIGMPLMLWTCLVLFITQIKNWPRLVLFTSVLLMVLSPQVFWNVTRHDHWMSSLQGGGWIQSVAAAVDYHDEGLDFQLAEQRWISDGRAHDNANAFEVLKNKAPTFAWLSFKGVMRTLVGHVNVEWGMLALGNAPIGPAWFKQPEPREGPRVQGPWIMVWLFGLMLTVGLCVYTYWSTARAMLRLKRLDVFTVWATGSILFLVAIPMIFGDARFRLALWPLVLILWVRSARQAHESNGVSVLVER